MVNNDKFKSLTVFMIDLSRETNMGIYLRIMN